MLFKSKNEQLLVLTDLISILVNEQETNHQYAIFEECVPPLGGPPLHQHPDEELFYVLEGTFEFILNDPENPIKAFPGSVIHIPSNAVHTFKNVGETMGKMLVLLTPGNLLNYFRAIGNEIKKESDIPDLKKVPNIEKLNLDSVFKHAPSHQVKFIFPEIV